MGADMKLSDYKYQRVFWFNNDPWIGGYYLACNKKGEVHKDLSGCLEKAMRNKNYVDKGVHSDKSLTELLSNA